MPNHHLQTVFSWPFLHTKRGLVWQTGRDHMPHSEEPVLENGGNSILCSCIREDNFMQTGQHQALQVVNTNLIGISNSLACQSLQRPSPPRKAVSNPSSAERAQPVLFFKASHQPRALLPWACLYGRHTLQRRQISLKIIY